MANKLVRLVIDVELEKDVHDLLAKAAGRVRTIEGVGNAFDVEQIDIQEVDDKMAKLYKTGDGN